MEFRKENVIHLCLYLLLAAAMLTTPAWGGPEAVCVDYGYQGNPAIGHGIVVWEQTIDQGDHYDIFATIEATGELRRLSSSGMARWPAVDKNLVIWSDKRNGSYDIWGYDLLSQREYCICHMDENQIHAKIHEGTIVWVTGQYPRWPGIWGYSLSEKRVFKICDKTGNKWRPDIFGKRVVWGDYRAGNWDVYGADISNLDDPNEFLIAEGGNYQRSTAIDEYLVAYEDGKKVSVYNLLTKQRASYRTGLINDLDICNHQVIVSQWCGSGKGYDIWGYQVDLGLEFELTPYLICSAPKDQYCVDLYHDKTLSNGLTTGYWCDDQVSGYYQRDIYRQELDELTLPLSQNSFNLFSLGTLSKSWRQTGTANTDIDHSGEVELGDLGLFIEIYGKTVR